MKIRQNLLPKLLAPFIVISVTSMSVILFAFFALLFPFYSLLSLCGPPIIFLQFLFFESMEVTHQGMSSVNFCYSSYVICRHMLTNHYSFPSCVMLLQNLICSPFPVLPPQLIHIQLQVIQILNAVCGILFLFCDFFCCISFYAAVIV